MPRRGFGFGTALRNRAALGGGVSAFITVWDTENLGGTGSATQVILLPMSAGVEVDWGDGTINNLNTHTYVAGGIKTISIFEEVTGWDFANGGDKSKIIDVITAKLLNVDSDTMFQGCDNLVWTATDAPIISTTTLLSMFNGGTVLNSNFDTWDTSSVMLMSAVFVNCKAQIEVPDWNVGSCLSFASMFTEANSVFYDGVVWELKPAVSIDCSNMFRANSIMTEGMTFTNTASITNHGGMYSFTQVETFPDYDYTNSTNLGGMFQQACLEGSITAIDCPLNTNFGDTFSSNNLISITGIITGPALLSTQFMLSSNANLVTVGLFDTQNVTTARSMFNNSTSLTSLPAFNWSSCDNFTDFLNNVTLDTSNYDALLEEIDSNGLSSGTLDGGNSQYSVAGEVFRDSLLGKSWVITDGGLDGVVALPIQQGVNMWHHYKDVSKIIEGATAVNIAGWIDETGTYDLEQLTPSMQPTYNVDRADFDGGDALLTGVTTVGTTRLFADNTDAFTVAVLTNFDGDGYAITKVPSAGSSQFGIYRQGADLWCVVRGSFQTILTSYTGFEIFIAITWDGTECLAYVDGAAPVTLSVGTMTENTSVEIIVGNRENLGFGLTGGLCDDLIYDTTKTPTEIANLKTYLEAL